MKVEAQLNNKPSIRNVAKILMNSMYGRFGMHTDDLKHAILNEPKIFQLSQTYRIKDQIPLGAYSIVSYTLNELFQDVGSKINNQILSQFVRGLPTNTPCCNSCCSYGLQPNDY